VLSCVQPSGAVTYEEPTAAERELAMGFPRGVTAAPVVSEHTRRELLGQAMDLNSVMWVLAAARAAGERRLPLKGEAVVPQAAAGVQSQTVGCGPMAPRVFGATGQGVGGARGGGRVSPLSQPVGGRAGAEGVLVLQGEGWGVLAAVAV
jgi:hypothetical protein